MRETIQTTLFDAPVFHGAGLEPSDIPRLERQLDRVERLMKSGGWWTLETLAAAAQCSQASASARMRDLRNQLGYTVERERTAKVGVFRYRATK